jgi:hypothetical protein
MLFYALGESLLFDTQLRNSSSIAMQTEINENTFQSILPQNRP